jgi:SAM-dependent methyltransferase
MGETVREWTEERPAAEAMRGAAFYDRGALRFYTAILRINCLLFWRCPAGRIVRLYDEFVSARHLDVGVANGWALRASRFPTARPRLTLMDLNPDALAVAADNLAALRPRTVRANVLEPFPLPERAFDSVAMSFLLHCVPGDIPTKAVAFDHAKRVLAPGGVLFGATILGRGVPRTRRSRRAQAALIRRGHFNNGDDSLSDLETALARRFSAPRIERKGEVALFAARRA